MYSSYIVAYEDYHHSVHFSVYYFPLIQAAHEIPSSHIYTTLTHAEHQTNQLAHTHHFASQVNKLLEIPFKTYIKKVACYPSLVTAADFASFGAGLRDAEKIHINILVMEARKQAQLIFFLHSAMLYMNQ